MSNAYTRADLIAAVSETTKLPPEQVREIVEEALVQISLQLIAGRRVEFRGFGVFEPVTRKAKIGRNPRRPQAGDYIIPAKRTVKFRPGKDLGVELNPSE